MFKNVPVTSTRTYHWDYRAVRHSPLPLFTLDETQAAITQQAVRKKEIYTNVLKIMW